MTDQTIQSRTIEALRPLMSIMVVGLHMRPYYETAGGLFTDGIYEASVITIFRILFSLAVPTFFLFSGFLFFGRLQNWDTSVWTGKIRKRIRTILIPYMLWNLIAIGGYILTRYAGCIIKGNEMPDLIQSFSERGWIRLFWDRSLFGPIPKDSISLFGISVSTGVPMDGPTWFLRDLMIVMLFSPLVWFLNKKCGKSFIAVIVGLYLVDLWIPVCGFSSKSFCMFSIGAWLRMGDFDLTEVSSQYPVIEILSAVVLMFVAAISFGQNEWIFRISSRLFILAGIPTLIFIVSKNIPRVNRFSQSSFFVYVAHTILIVDATGFILKTVIHSDSKAVLFLMLCAATLISYYICHLIWLLLKRFLPRTLGILTGSR